MRKPDLLVKNHDLITRAIAAAAHPPLKRQALANLRMLLTADEERQRTLSSTSASSVRVSHPWIAPTGFTPRSRSANVRGLSCGHRQRRRWFSTRWVRHRRRVPP